MDHVPFDVDVRAGFAHALEQVTNGIAELFELDEALLKKYDPETIAQLPEGADALFAVLYTVVNLLTEQKDEDAIKLMRLAAAGMQPAIHKQLGIVPFMFPAISKEEMH